MVISESTRQICSRIEEQILLRHKSIRQFAVHVNWNYYKVLGYTKARKNPSNEFYNLLIRQEFDLVYIISGNSKKDIMTYVFTEMENYYDRAQIVQVKSQNDLENEFVGTIDRIKNFRNSSRNNYN